MWKFSLFLLQLLLFSLVLSAPRDSDVLLNIPKQIDEYIDTNLHNSIIAISDDQDNAENGDSEDPEDSDDSQNPDDSQDSSDEFDPQDSNSKIVGGHDIDISDSPYQLSLQALNSHFCGAVLISSNWAITAAHCTIEAYGYEIMVRAGSSKTGDGGQASLVKQVVYHPDYDSTTDDYDISLIELDSPIVADKAQAARLPEIGDSLTVGSSAVISGWGVTEEGSTDPALNLQAIEVPVISHEDCANAYPDNVITDRMFCSGYLGEGGKDACSGDSGGPVIIDGVLAGIVSWGKGCANPEYPGVNTSIYAVRSWIQKITGI